MGMARYSVEDTFLPFQKSGVFPGFWVVFWIEGTKKHRQIPFLTFQVDRIKNVFNN